MSMSQPSPRRGRPRGSEAPELLAIARGMFIANGYRRTTMDAVAAQARISKQSLYRNYPSKDALYSAVVQDWVDRGYDAMRPHATALSEARQAREGLLGLARVLQAGLLSPPVLQMRTLIAAEAQRFPMSPPSLSSRRCNSSLSPRPRFRSHASATPAPRGRSSRPP